MHRVAVLSRRLALAYSAALLVATFAPSSSRADQIYQTGFESPTFTAGKTVDGQGGFAVTVGDPSAITVTTDQPHAGLQALLFTGSNLTQTTPTSGFYEGQAAVATNFDVAAHGGILILDAFVRLDGPATPDTPGVPFSGDNVSVNLEANLKDGSYFSTYLSSNGNAIGYTTNYDFQTPVALGVYHELQLAVDFTNRTSTFFVDGKAFGTQAFDNSVTSSVLTSASLTMYAIDPPADHTLYNARVDDFSVRSVPEPASLLLVAIGGAGAWQSLRKRARRKTCGGVE